MRSIRCPRLQDQPRPRSKPSYRRRAAAEEGYTTVETAIALGALTVVFIGLVAGVAALAAQLSAIHSAGAAARAAALGEPFQPARGTASISSTGALVTATVSVPSPLGMMRSTAVFPAEMRAEKQ